MSKAVLVDAGPLIALLDRSDEAHARCVEALEGIRERLLTVWPVLTEVSRLLGHARAQQALLEMVEEGELELAALSADDVPRLRELMAKYADLPMDLADAALVLVAEREGIRRVLTTDGDFQVYRPSNGRAFEILPPAKSR